MPVVVVADDVNNGSFDIVVKDADAVVACDYRLANLIVVARFYFSGDNFIKFDGTGGPEGTICNPFGLLLTGVFLFGQEGETIKVNGAQL